MKKLVYIIIGIILTACSDDIYTLSESSAEGHAMRFEVKRIMKSETNITCPAMVEGTAVTVSTRSWDSIPIWMFVS